MRKHNEGINLIHLMPRKSAPSIWESALSPSTLAQVYCRAFGDVATEKSKMLFGKYATALWWIGWNGVRF